MFRYVDQHFHTPENFLETNTELAGNADIRERLFDGFRSEIIAIADGEPVGEPADVLEDLLVDDDIDNDPATANIPDPITQGRIERDQAIEEVLLDVFDSPDFNAVFIAALSVTQQELITSADLEPAALLRNKGEVFFDMRALYNPIYEGLRANELTTEITQSEVPPGYGVFKVADRETTVNFLWSMLRNAPNWRGLTMAGAILSLIGAVAIADRRPSTALQFGGGIAGVGVVLFVIVYLIRFLVPLLAGGGKAANPVVAVYAANMAPLISTLIRMIIIGVVLSVIGYATRMIWPDDWVYGSVSDERGLRSIRRRRGEPEAPQPQQQQRPLQPAAMAPGYGYAQPPYPGYPQGWGQPPYQGHYPPGYGAPYPAGPYAQPAQPLPQHYQGVGKPTVPVMPVQLNAGADDLVPPAAPPLDAKPGDLPADAAQMVPRVVATTDSAPDNAESHGAAESDGAAESHAESHGSTESNGVKATVVETESPSQGNAPETGDDESTSFQELIDDTKGAADEWTSEKDW